MGNNHNKYFGKEKRKILLLGLEASGKTTLIEYLKTGKYNKNVPVTKDLNIQDKHFDDIVATFFDLSGGERQRVFWKQNYEGSQGIIYLIDSSKSDTLNTSLQQLIKCIDNVEIESIPFAITISKKDINGGKDIQKIKEKVQSTLGIKNNKRNYKIFAISMQDDNSVKEMIKWLLSQTKPL